MSENRLKTLPLAVPTAHFPCHLRGLFGLREAPTLFRRGHQTLRLDEAFLTSPVRMWIFGSQELNHIKGGFRHHIRLRAIIIRETSSEFHCWIVGMAPCQAAERFGLAEDPPSGLTGPARQVNSTRRGVSHV